MVPGSTQPVVADLTSAIDWYFEIALVLLVASGFATLASTGGLDLPSIVLSLLALATRGYLLLEHRRIVISERWTTPLTLAYFVFFAADYFLVSHSFLPATVHLVLFGVMIRMFSLRRERDYVALAVLAFLMVLAAAVLTVDGLFLVCFCCFMLMSVATFVLLEMRRSAQAATPHRQSLHEIQQPLRFARALFRVAPLLMLMMLCGAALLFFILPRRSGGYLGGFAFGTDFSSGFSDHVQLGQIGQIQQSNAVVMHVQIENDRTGRYDLRWRGVALGDFDGHSWSKPQKQSPLQHWSDFSFPVPPFEQASDDTMAALRVRNLKIIHYRVLMEPIGTNVFFLAPWARSVSGAYQALAADSGGAVYNFDTQHAISRYEADSEVGAPSSSELRKAGLSYPQDITSTYLELPPLDPRIAMLARQVTASTETEYDRAAVLENYLRTRYGYTLELPEAAPADPLANFLFERKRGHCEYFASAMAVMLRTLGIPSRVVNGFRSDEFNDLTGNYVVRAKDAHAWVEAYFPGYGWQTFDPTPGGGSTIPQGWARAALYFDAMASFWRDWIVSYDTSHQYVIGQNALSRSHNLWEGFRNWARDRYASILDRAHHVQERAQQSPTKWIMAAVVLCVSFLVLRNFARLARLVRDYQLLANPERSPELAASLWFRQVSKVLARVGSRRAESETAHEFAQRIENLELRELVTQFMEVYKAARFGNSLQEASRLPSLCQQIETLVRGS